MLIRHDVKKARIITYLKGADGQAHRRLEKCYETCINVVFIVLTKLTAFEAVFWLNELPRENTKVSTMYSQLI
jgi:hypothetical protein